MNIEQDTRVYRFKAPLLKVSNAPLEFRASGPIPIYAEGERRKLLGFASLQDGVNHATVDCAIDPASPERFDLESDDTRYYYLDAMLEYRGYLGGMGGYQDPTVAYINALILTTEEVPGQEPLDPKLGSLS